MTIKRTDAEQIAKLEYELEESRKNQASTQTAASEKGNYKDGTYEGKGLGYGGLIAVSVTVSGGKISAIDVTSHAGEDNAYYSIGQGMTQKIIDAQSTDVDTVSGATLTSTGIRTAVAAALENAQ